MTIQHGTKDGDPAPIRKGNAAGKNKLSSAPMPEHWKARADSNRPYSGLFKRSEPNIKPSSVRTETEPERKTRTPGDRTTQYKPDTATTTPER